MKIKIKREQWFEYLHYCLIFWLIQLIKSNFFAVVGIDLMYILTICFSVFIIVIYKDRIKLFKSYTIWFLLLCECSVLSMILTGGSLSLGTVLNTLGKILFVYVVISFDSQMFLNRFIKLAYLLSVCSLICWLLYVILGPEVVEILCKVLYNVDGEQYGLFFIGYNFSETGIIELRNTYMYAEPGVHQMIPNTALILIFYYRERVDANIIKYVVIFVLNILTIQSTEGYLILIATLVMVLFQRIELNGKQLKKIKVLIVTSGLGFIVYFTRYLTVDSFLYKNLYAKIFNESNTLDFTRGTAGVRTDSFDKIQQFLETDSITLLFGYGSTGSGVSNPFSGINGIFVLVSYFGVVFSICFLGYVVYALISNRKNIVEVFTVLFAFICHGMSQPDFMNVLCVVMLLYGSIYNLNIRKEEKIV